MSSENLVAQKKTAIISIIVPVYNSEQYLLETLQCLARQTFQQFEVIIVNDGSTDNSKAIINNFILASLNAEQNSSVINNQHSSFATFKLFNVKNSGVSKARNTGLKHATCKYIMFLDADDILSDNFLGQMYSAAVANEKNADNANTNSNISLILAESIYDYFSANSALNKAWQINQYDYFSNDKDNKINDKLLASKILVYVWGKLYKRCVIDKYNLSFNEDLAVGEDYLFNLQYLLSQFSNEIKNGTEFHVNKTLSFCSDCSFYYRQSSNSLSRSANEAHITKRMNCALATADYLLKQGFDSLGKQSYIAIGYINPLKILVKSKNYRLLMVIAKQLDFNVINFTNLRRSNLSQRAKMLAIIFYPILFLLRKR